MSLADSPDLDSTEPLSDVDAVFEAMDAAPTADDFAARIAELHPADIADALEQMKQGERRNFFERIGEDLPAEVLAELSDAAREDILPIVDAGVLAKAAQDLDSDDVVYLLEDLDEDQQREVLDALDARDRAAAEQALSYPEYSAGRLMQREFAAAPSFWTVGQTIDYIRAAKHLPEEFYAVVVVDPRFRPVGTVSLSRLVAGRRPATLASIMNDDLTTFTVDQPQDEIAYAFNQYHLVSAPVIDGDGRLAGVITIDDAMQALDEESGEDLMLMGGVGDESLTDAVMETARGRLPWLFANLLTAIMASFIIALFDATIEKIVALAVLMTIVASMGGNAGTQTMTVAVRALATKDLTRRNAWRIITRETLVGLINGVAFALITGVATWAVYGDFTLGAVLGVAMIINMVGAALAGILIPMGLEKAGADPALASGVFVTTVTDVVGFFAFLGLAGALLL